MTADREHAITEAFVSLANNLANGFDVVELLSGLTSDCARLLDIASAGLLLADRRQVLHVMAASSERTRNLELFQTQRDEGPCLDCYRTGSPVVVPDLRSEAERWPQFVPVALKAGFASVHAIPMRLIDETLGTLGLFGTSIGDIDDDDLNLAQALAHVASVAIVAGNTLADRNTVAEQLQVALSSRVVIEQAKGFLAYHGRVHTDEAFVRLRDYARDHNQRLTVTARAVLARELSAEELLSANRLK